MKYAGMIFIVVSAASFGLRYSASLRNRCILINQLLAAMQILRNEISVCGTPLPQAFALVAVSSSDSVARLFSFLAKEMESRRWMTPMAAMEQGLRENPVFTTENILAHILLQCASGLGKYDKSSQLQTIDLTVSNLQSLLTRTEQESSLRGKTYKTLGICAGLSMVILLA